MLLNPPLLFLHPARTVLQSFSRVPFISIHSYILGGSDPPPRLRCDELVLYWGKGNSGSLAAASPSPLGSPRWLQRVGLAMLLCVAVNEAGTSLQMQVRADITCWEHP